MYVCTTLILNTNVTQMFTMYLSSKFFNAGWVGHRNQDLHIRDDSGTDDSRRMAPATTIGFGEEGARIKEN
jgi:hypothetical protein